MKKYKKTLFVLTISSLLLSGCSTGKNQNVTNTADSSGSTPEAASSETEDAGLTINDLGITEYKCEDDYATDYLLAIQNNSSQTIDIYANATAYDAEGNMLGAANGSIDVLGPGETSAMFLYFDGAHDVDHIDYKDNLQYSATPYYQPVLANLSVQEGVNAENLTLAITNNGTISAEFVEAYAVFMDAAGTPLQISSTYIVDSNSEIAPGATQSGSIDYYSTYSKGAFDHAAYYLTGRGEK